jgi:hypothetical protein
MWEFIKDPENRAIISWIGGGAVVIIGGLWAMIKFLLSSGRQRQPSQSISASEGGVAAGRDIREAKIHTRGSDRSR